MAWRVWWAGLRPRQRAGSSPTLPPPPGTGWGRLHTRIDESTEDPRRQGTPQLAGLPASSGISDVRLSGACRGGPGWGHAGPGVSTVATARRRRRRAKGPPRGTHWPSSYSGGPVARPRSSPDSAARSGRCLLAGGVAQPHHALRGRSVSGVLQRRPQWRWRPGILAGTYCGGLTILPVASPLMPSSSREGLRSALMSLSESAVERLNILAKGTPGVAASTSSLVYVTGNCAPSRLAVRIAMPCCWCRSPLVHDPLRDVISDEMRRMRSPARIVSMRRARVRGTSASALGWRSSAP